MTIVEDVSRIVPMNHAEQSFLVQVTHNHPEISGVIRRLVSAVDEKSIELNTLKASLSALVGNLGEPGETGCAATSDADATDSHAPIESPPAPPEAPIESPPTVDAPVATAVAVESPPAHAGTTPESPDEAKS